MAFSATHAFVPFFLALLLRRFYKFPLVYLYIAAFGGIAPDFDFALVLLFGEENLHKSLTHYFFIPVLLALALPFLQKTWRLPLVFFIFGYMTHLVLDWVFNLFPANFQVWAMIDGVFVTVYLLYMLFVQRKSLFSEKQA
ncbi:MAG: metal-dependent hydrolase [Nanoarchaeota archaeon]|nr:metal-dependent hydrolase [Nanoarchaeota archaeon]